MTLVTGQRIKIIQPIPSEYVRVNEVWRIMSVNDIDVFLSGPFGSTIIPITKLSQYSSAWLLVA